MRGVGAGRVGGEVVVGEVEEEEVECIPCYEPAPHRGGVRVDGATGPIPPRERRTGALRLEQVVEEEALRAGDVAEERNRCAMPGATPVGREVDGAGDEAGVGQRLEQRRRPAAQMLGVHPDQRVAQRASEACGARRAKRGAVLDEPPFPAVPPDEVRDLVDVRVAARRDGGEAYGGERGEDGHGAAAPALRGDGADRRQGAALERRLEHGRREPVDDDENQLPGGHVAATWTAYGAPRTARALAACVAMRAPAGRPPSRTRRPGSGRVAR